MEKVSLDSISCDRPGSVHGLDCLLELDDNTIGSKQNKMRHAFSGRPMRFGSRDVLSAVRVIRQAAKFVAEAPNYDRRVVAIAQNHILLSGAEASR